MGCSSKNGYFAVKDNKGAWNRHFEMPPGWLLPQPFVFFAPNSIDTQLQKHCWRLVLGHPKTNIEPTGPTSFMLPEASRSWAACLTLLSVRSHASDFRFRVEQCLEVAPSLIQSSVDLKYKAETKTKNTSPCTFTRWRQGNHFVGDPAVILTKSHGLQFIRWVG
jgi:hypothetical protein